MNATNDGGNWKEAPECPRCGSDAIDTNRGVTGDGLDYSVLVCEDCDWQSDPE